jgi:hypothetical protein
MRKRAEQARRKLTELILPERLELLTRGGDPALGRL